MTISIFIREAKPQDANSIVRLIAEHVTASGERSALTPDDVEKYLASPVSRIVLAEQHDRVVGLLSYSLRPDLYHAGNACLIEELVVEAQLRGQGVGSALLIELLSQLSAAGCVEVALAVMPDNASAIKLYRKHGLTDEAIFLERHFQVERQNIPRGGTP
jgi:ribosomal protein S18 acetylase RimI-like enzyme